MTAANLLYVDSPVGSGFSYVDSPDQYTTNNTQVADDVLKFFQFFFARYPQFQKTPFYIFSESYGGKMTTDIALSVLHAVDTGVLNVSLRGIEMGDSWISGQADVDGWGPFLYALSEIDESGAASIKVGSDKCDAAIAAGDWAGATSAWGETEGLVSQAANDVDFYNVLCPSDLDFCQNSLARGRDPKVAPPPPMSAADLALRAAGVDAAALNSLYGRHLFPFVQGLGDLPSLMNNQVRKYLNSGKQGQVIPDSVSWGAQSNGVFSAMSGDFMKPVIHNVDALLKDGRINVTVAEGQLDLICLTAGARAWMANLTWPGLPGFYAAPTLPLTGGGQYVETLVKRSNPLSMYMVQRAGHMLPQDNPVGALAMMLDIIGAPPPPL